MEDVRNENNSEFSSSEPSTSGDISKNRSLRGTRKRRLESNEYEQDFEEMKKLLMKMCPGVFGTEPDQGTKFLNFFVNIVECAEHRSTCADSDCSQCRYLKPEMFHRLCETFERKCDDAEDNRNFSKKRAIESSCESYNDKFIELSELGRGGFGKVFKVQHKVDQGVYAVKKVQTKVRKYKKFKQSVEEVEILAKLDHINIIKYNTCWIEYTPGPNSKIKFSRVLSDIIKDFQCMQFESHEIEFAHRKSEEIDFAKSESQEIGNVSQEDTETESSDQSSQESSDNKKEAVYTLFIQMSLCAKNLREWMNEREEPSSPITLKNVIVQILSALNYIHSLNVVHHDLKPENIFIAEGSKDPHVKLGDFGLACASRKLGGHSQDFGTGFYTAPEQLNKICDPKSDIYSFGIILFELLCPMNSGHERVDNLQKLKKNQFPKELDEVDPVLINILKMSILADSSERPSAEELLDILKNDNDLLLANLIAEVERLKDENHDLKSQLLAKEKELVLINQNLTEIRNWKNDLFSNNRDFL